MSMVTGVFALSIVEFNFFNYMLVIILFGGLELEVFPLIILWC